MNTEIIFGPAGTGKTTTLLNICDEIFSKGVHPMDVAFFTFTRKAANEALDRACKKFSFEPDDLPYFRTLHSFAFQCLGMVRGQVVSNDDYRLICETLGFPVSSCPVKSGDEDFIFVQKELGDKLIFADNFARIKKKSIREAFSDLNPEDYSYYELRLFSDYYEKFKSAESVLDYTDMLYKYIQEGETLPFKYVIVDEAQDLSPIQWDLVNKVTLNCEKRYIAGDDDQSIFVWAGADARQLIDLEGERKILNKSYRLPKTVYSMAMNIVSCISHRVEKDFAPREEEGTIEYHQDLDSLDMSQGNWLLLGRNNYHLQSAVDHCFTNGWWFDAPRMKSYTKYIRVILAYQAMIEGQGISYALAKDIMKYIKCDKDIKHRHRNTKVTKIDFIDIGIKPKVWYDDFDLMEVEDVEYIRSALRNGEDLRKEPRIKISTIHGAKGGEADKVALMTDISKRTYDDFDNDPDTEHRVWYVGVTRAKHELHIIKPKTQRSYYDYLC